MSALSKEYVSKEEKRAKPVEALRACSEKRLEEAKAALEKDASFSRGETERRRQVSLE